MLLNYKLNYVENDEEFDIRFTIVQMLGQGKLNKNYEFLEFSEVYLRYYQNPKDNACLYELLKTPALFYAVSKDNSNNKAIVKMEDLEEFIQAK